MHRQTYLQMKIIETIHYKEVTEKMSPLKKRQIKIKTGGSFSTPISQTCSAELTSKTQLR